MKNIIYLFLCIVLIQFFASCGVMFGGSRYAGIIVAKDHPNADIYVNGEKRGTGQVAGVYRRDKPLHVELKQEGCENKTKSFDRTLRTGNFILSIITFGLIGLAVDLGTGAAYKPDHIGEPTAIEKIDLKNYKFIVDYSGCKQ